MKTRLNHSSGYSTRCGCPTHLENVRLIRTMATNGLMEAQRSTQPNPLASVDISRLRIVADANILCE